MRPVERGPCPKDENGADKVYADYKEARPDLGNRLGEYCSFCEIPLVSGLELEHVRHKKGNEDLECTWSNFLVACKSCNTTKGTKVETQADVDQHLWPHLRHSLSAFVYERGGIVRVADGQVNEQATKTANMVGLSKRPGHGLTNAQLRKGSDPRYGARSSAWDEAMEALNDLGELDELDTARERKMILKLARHTGFWSVWMTVFSEDEPMRMALCAAFPGTAADRIGPTPSEEAFCQEDR